MSRTQTQTNDPAEYRYPTPESWMNGLVTRYSSSVLVPTHRIILGARKRYITKSGLFPGITFDQRRQAADLVKRHTPIWYYASKQIPVECVTEARKPSSRPLEKVDQQAKVSSKECFR